MVSKPYIGITGAASCVEVESIIQEFITNGYTMNTPHIPMLGFLVSAKNLKNPHIPFGNRYPRFNDISDLLKQTEDRVLTMIHYSPSQDTSARLSLATEVIEIFERANLYAEGFEGDMELQLEEGVVRLDEMEGSVKVEMNRGRIWISGLDRKKVMARTRMGELVLHRSDGTKEDHENFLDEEFGRAKDQLEVITVMGSIYLQE